MSDKEMIGFSLVLCTYNGISRLKPTLEHLARLIIPENHLVELIVVDNASTDNTGYFAQQTWADLGAPFHIQVLEEKRPGKGYAIEKGYDTAEYSYILTVDDDNWLASDYLTQAVCLFKQYPDVGILQGYSEGVFETTPPEWAAELKSLIVVGGPIKEPGYFPKNHFGVWGAGMVILNEDWKKLRKLGFAFLTSKAAGKAAGEDHETAIGILMLGKKIFYSDKLKYQHFMPAGRVTWARLKDGFTIWAYLLYHNFLYSLVIEAYRKKIEINKWTIYKRTLLRFAKNISDYTPKQYLAYLVKPQQEYYQLRIYRDIMYYKWFRRLSQNAVRDIDLLKKWMVPLLQENSSAFEINLSINK